MEGPGVRPVSGWKVTDLREELPGTEAEAHAATEQGVSNVRIRLE